MTRSRRGGSSAPPRLFTRYLSAALPRDRRGRSILGDLLEEWHERPSGLRRALWYRWQCIRIGSGYLFVPRRLPALSANRSAPRVPGRVGAALIRDGFRHAVRRVLQAPTAGLLTILALGVGVAAPAVMYSLLIGVTRDLPVSEPEALVNVGRRYAPGLIRFAPMAWLAPVLESVGAGELSDAGVFGTDRFDVGWDDAFAERRRGAYVTPSVFSTLGVQARLGRVPLDDDVDGRSGPVVVLSEELWRSRFASDDAIVGSTLRISGRLHTVIGVMPPGFAFPDDAQLWVPLDPQGQPEHRVDSWEMIGRLAPGARLDDLRERVAHIGEGLRSAGLVRTDVRTPVDVQPWRDRMISPSNRRMAGILLLLASFVLVIACADVAHLFLARALARRPATAVRMALGAGRARIVAEHVIEAFVLASLGGVLGLALTHFGVRAIVRGLGDKLSWWMEVRVDPSVVLFSIGLVAIAALATGLVPAFQSSRVRPATVLRSEGRGSSTGRAGFRIIGVLVTAEVALSCVLLVITGLMVRGAVVNLRTDGEYATTSVLVARYELPRDRYPDASSVNGFHRDAVDAIARYPEVEAVGLVSHVPGVFSLRRAVEVDGEAYGDDEAVPRNHVVHVSPGFLSALAVRPVLGRGFLQSEAREGPPVALVNEAFVRARLGGRDPLGARVRVGGERALDGTAVESGPWATVVGVVPQLGLDVGLDDDPTAIYLPSASAALRAPALLVRVAAGSSPADLAGLVRSEVARLDADVALYEVATLEDQIRATHRAEDLFAAIFSVFGGAGLLLAGVGLYGLLSFTVTRRMRELGIRAALGAGPRAVVWAGIRAGAIQLGTGLLIGLGLATLVAPGLGEILMGYAPGDPLVYLVVSTTLALTGIAAAATPVRRALSLDVASVLRMD